MPLYPYKCKECGHEFEVIRKSTDDGNEICPECKCELTIEDRTVGKTSFKLEGSGWFKDAYGSKQAAKYSYQND